MIDADKIPCNCCRELITMGAPVCHHCGRNQKVLMRGLAPTAQGLALIVSVALVLLSWGQLNQATRQRQSADAALSRAEAAERRVTEVARATIPVFESLLKATGRWGISYSSEEIEKLTRPLKEAIAEDKDSQASGSRKILEMRGNWMGMSELAQLLNVAAWPIIVLVLVFTFYRPIKRILERIVQVRAGSKGIELVLKELEKEGKLPFGSRKELSGLSAHDIWALDTYANAPDPMLVNTLKVPQRVAVRTLCDANLLQLEGSGDNRSVTVTSLGRDILRAAGKLI